MRVLFVSIMVVHGLLHIPAFLRAFDLFGLPGFSQPMPASSGVMWLVTAVLFVLSGVLYAVRSRYWWIVCFMAIVFSQILMISSGSAAGYGTIVNTLLLMAVITGYAGWEFKNQYRRDIAGGLERTGAITGELLQEEDLAHLPQPVQKYLVYTGAVGKPRIYSFSAAFRAEMRTRGGKWFGLTVEQTDFFDEYERFFFMDATLKGFPAKGYHKYKDGKSGMLVKMFSLFPVIKARGEEMFKAETVTLLNDICFLAPAALIDRNIRWEPVDSLTARAVFSNRGVQISAELHFNEEGQLTNFISDDRYDVNDKKTYRFSTPIRDYKDFGGYRIGSYGEAVWHYPEGEFTYGKYTLTDLQYNLTEYCRRAGLYSSICQPCFDRLSNRLPKYNDRWGASPVSMLMTRLSAFMLVFSFVAHSNYRF